MSIRPTGDTHRSGKVDNDICSSTGLADGGATILISKQPPIEMGFGGQQIALVAIALPVSEHQIMCKVTRVARPGHEMIDLSAVDPSPAV
jgi:hypothetical protein